MTVFRDPKPASSRVPAIDLLETVAFGAARRLWYSVRVERVGDIARRRVETRVVGDVLYVGATDGTLYGLE